MTQSRTMPLFGATIGIGVALGACVSVFAFLLARYGPSGGNWSFKGNGALVAYTVMGPVLTAGWTAIVLHARGVSSWPVLGLGAGLVGLVLAFIAAAVLPILGVAADGIITPIALIALVGWTLVAPVGAALRPPGEGATAVHEHVVASVVWALAAVAGLVAVGVVYPAGS